MSPEGISPDVWYVLGPFFAFTVAILYALLRGNLVPKRTVDARIQDKEDKIKDTQELAAFWEKAAKKKDEVIEEQLIPAIKAMTEDNRTTVNFIKSLKPAGEPT